MKNLPSFEQFISESTLNEKASLNPDQLSIAKQVSKITNDFLKKDLKRLASKYGVQIGPSYEGVQLYNSKDQALFTIEYSKMMGYSTLIKIYKVIVEEYSNFGTLAPNLNGNKIEKLNISDVRDAMDFWYNDYDMRMKKGSPDSKPAANEDLPLLQGFGWDMSAHNPEKASVLTDEYVIQYKKLIENILNGIELNLKSFEKNNLL
jgi:hypothetical protein